PTLAAVLDPDLCTDKSCFDVKAKAHAVNIAEKTRAEGGFVLEGEEAAKVAPYGSAASHFSGYTRTDRVLHRGGKDMPVSEAIAAMAAEGHEPPKKGAIIDSAGRVAEVIT